MAQGKTMLVRLIVFSFSLFIFTTHALADELFIHSPEVQEFINQMVKQHHFNHNQLMTLFSHVKIRPTAIQSVKMPLEKKPWHSYRKLFITDWRIQHGAKFWKKHEMILAKAEKEFGVPASIIVATIGVETKYGQHTGDFRVIDALSSLAFSQSPRASYFKKELEQFLLLSREQHLAPLEVMGSYAGAIGQPQFMPSSYRYYAVNFSGNSRIDLSHNEADIIGSIANYYKQNGWKTHGPVTIPASLQSSQFQFLSKEKQPWHFSQLDLAKHGIQSNAKTFLHQDTKLIELQGYFTKQYWFTFHNFDVIKRYNSSELYAMAVYQLSYYITKLREKEKNG